MGDGRARGRHSRSKRDDRPLRCSCKLPICPAPGEHPAAPDWQVQATNEPHAVAWWWSGRDAPNLVLPTGWAFDALHVPSALGTRVLGRFRDPYLQIPAGPVIRGSSGDWWFFVAPALEDDQPWLDRLATMGVRHRGVGAYVLAPPSTGGASGGVNWVVPPSAETVRLPTVEQFLALALGAAPRYGTNAPEQYELHSGSDRRYEDGLYADESYPEAPYQDNSYQEGPYDERPSYRDGPYRDSPPYSGPPSTDGPYPEQPYPGERYTEPPYREGTGTYETPREGPEEHRHRWD